MEVSENLARSRHCDKAGLLLSQVFSIFHYWAYCFEAKQDVSFNACVENPAQDICVNPYVRTKACV